MLTLNFKKSTLEGVQLTENVNAELLDLLINSSVLNTVSWQTFENEKQQLKEYKRLVKGGKANITYNRTKCSKNVGRVYANKNLGLVSLRREIRHTIARDYYVDIDIVNCHPVLLSQICHKNDIPCIALDHYINNRPSILESVMTAYNVNKDKAKNLFISLLYFGTFENWSTENHIVGEVLPFISEFKNELNNIGNVIVGANPKLKKEAEDKDKLNVKGTVCSNYLQTLECNILESVYNYCIIKKYITNNGVLCYDGLMILKDSFGNHILKEFEDEVFSKTGFKVKFTIKELNEGYTIEVLRESQIEEESDYTRMKKAFEKGNFKILNPISFGIDTEDGLNIVSKSAFFDTYENMRIEDEVEDYRGKMKQKEMSFIDKWLKDESIRTYNKIDFLPCQVAPKGVYNTFKGFEASTKELFDIDIDNSLLMTHIKHLCGNDDNVLKYVLDCFANMIQKPYDLTRTALLMKSIQGCGKDTLFDYFGNRILGSKYYVVLTDVKNIFGSFNAMLENKILVVINESKSKTAFEYDDAIKDAITRSENIIVRKGKEGYKNTNNIFYTFLTNNKNALKVEENDRRIVAIQANDKIANDVVYFDALRNELNSGKLDRAFFEYLLKRNISNVNFTKDRPTTKLYEALKEHNTPVLARFLCEYVDKHQKITKENATSFITDFNFWMQTNNYNFEYSATQFGLDLKDYNGIEKKRMNTGIRYTINNDILKQYLISKNYYEILPFDDDEDVKVYTPSKLDKYLDV